MIKYFILGACTAIASFFSDQVLKYYLLYVLDFNMEFPIKIYSFLEFQLVWNYGVAYGFFQQYNIIGQYLLIIFTVLAVVFFIYELLHSTRILYSISLGLIIGGALGNACDRIFYGAVIDYIHFFMPDRSFSWYVFNLADIYISCGFVGCICEKSYIFNKK